MLGLTQSMPCLGITLILPDLPHLGKLRSIDYIKANKCHLIKMRIALTISDFQMTHLVQNKIKNEK